MEITSATLEAHNLYFVLVLLLLPIVFIILKKLKLSYSSKTLPLPPGPTPWPIIGNIHQMGTMPHVVLANLAKIYGPLISVKIGTKTVVVASSPSVAMEILKTHDRVLSGRYIPNAMPYPPSQVNEVSILFNGECNDKWRYLRALSRTELLSGKALESQEWLREKKAMEMVEFLKGNEPGKAVLVKKLVLATIFNTLSNILMSRDIIELKYDSGSDSKMQYVFKEAGEALGAYNLADLYPIFSKLDVQGLKKRVKKVYQTVESMWLPLVEERRKRKNQTPLDQRDFLDTLVDNEFSDDGCVNLLMELFGASADTTSTVIEWLMSELVKNPEVMKNLREELDREFNQGMLKESRLIQLPYLQACFKESSRLHPTSPLLMARRALESCQVNNYTIPKDAQILVNVWAIGRDPKVWEEPLKYKPERFLNSNIDYKGHHFELLPFGGGRRICPGLPMAARQVPLIIATLVHYFDWLPPQGEKLDELDMTETFGLSIKRANPLLLIPRARK